jgi:hypothetical protein
VAQSFLQRVYRRLARFVYAVFGIEIAVPPANLAEEVANRLFDRLTPEQRTLLRLRFGVDVDTSAKLDEIAAHLSSRLRHVREVESQALIRLYRWKHRKSLLPAVQRRLIKRIAAAHETILNALCGAPPLRAVLVGWHDQLVDGRRSAGEIAEPPDPVIPDNPEEETPTSELVLAAKLRRALWVHAKGRKPARHHGEVPAGRDNKQARARELLLAVRFNAQSIRAMAESLLRHARRIAVESDELIPQLLDPAEDRNTGASPDTPPGFKPPWPDDPPDLAKLDPALANTVIEESGMPVDELWEQGHTALLQLADRFCFTGEHDFAAAAESAVRAVVTKS